MRDAEELSLEVFLPEKVDKVHEVDKVDKVEVV